ncbi:hypothetical protein [Rhodopila globiformis]|uniref:Uncharacterized protein n=1 Tax=Rhodopila globiformis TaxID=1071 RepID=A0A2S6NL69_RHOGL|nr:hypothetical protein [Rhodopila globiformis]PPQ35972.1 hypothetical protein CCS01_06170 [Rhodopila globiformis]
MNKSKSQSKQAKADREPERMESQSDLNRAAHKIAWTRMNGRNDALNPFTGAEADGSAREERQE